MTLNEYIQKLTELAEKTQSGNHIVCFEGDEWEPALWNEITSVTLEVTDDDYGDATSTHFVHRRGTFVALSHSRCQ